MKHNIKMILIGIAIGLLISFVFTFITSHKSEVKKSTDIIRQELDKIDKANTSDIVDALKDLPEMPFEQLYKCIYSVYGEPDYMLVDEDPIMCFSTLVYTKSCVNIILVSESNKDAWRIFSITEDKAI